MKTSELTGAALDWAVAKALDIQGKALDWMAEPYSTNWTVGGPLIEREMIKVAPNLGGSWSGQIRHTKEHPLVAHKVLAGWTNQHGPTPLVAAMRCYVLSKLGDEIDIPEFS